MQTRRFSLQLILLAALAGIMLAGCQNADATAQPFVVADLFATPGKALATIELTATLEPSATLPNMPTNTPAPTLPLPTVSILQQPTLPIATFGPFPTPTLPGGGAGTPAPTALSVVTCTSIPGMPFTPVWQNIAEVQTFMRCPTSDVMPMNGVWQTYEHGWMFWREADKSIFVVSELRIRQGQPSDTWWRLDDTWNDSEPSEDPSLTAPNGLRQPQRGFGKVWRSNGFVRDALGWATSDERGLTIQWMNFEGGWLMTGPDGVPIYVMIPADAAPHSNGHHLGPKP